MTDSDLWPEGLRSPAKHSDLAEALEVHPKTVLTWVHVDGLEAVRLGRQVRIPRSSFVRLAKARQVVGAV